MQNVWLDAAGKMTTRGEQVLWQQQYLNCCSELGQWDVINEYARGTENYAAYMDVAWKCSDWQGLKDWVLPKGAVEDTPGVSMVKAFVLLQDADVTQANLHTENAITQTLHRWVCCVLDVACRAWAFVEVLLRRWPHACCIVKSSKLD